MYYLANFSHGARSIESYNYQFGPYPKRVTCATCQIYSTGGPLIGRKGWNLIYGISEKCQKFIT